MKESFFLSRKQIPVKNVLLETAKLNSFEIHKISRLRPAANICPVKICSFKARSFYFIHVLVKVFLEFLCFLKFFFC